MLYSIAGKEQKDIPQRRLEQWNQWIAQISKVSYDRIVEKINNHCNSVQLFVSGPLATELLEDEDWQDLQNACGDHAGHFWGLMVWQTMIDRRDEWFFKKEQEKGTVYFQQQKQSGAGR